ncbi:MAG: HAD family phosphatase [Bacteroidales bacterium]|nr:HAD family phosphatase [Bacteroidales bacterium]MBD5205824.1 HAD family phosphatase [Bacteroidales bacterium]MBD5223803.1 HAD family phosphatase [Bacteroidales bacterium]
MNTPNVQHTAIGFLFDLDGVIIDSEKEYTRIWTEIDELYPTGVENFAIKIKGQTLPEILNAHYPEEIHNEIIAQLNKREQKMHYELLPGAQSLLNYLNEESIGRALVTSSNELKMRHLRKELPFLEDWFNKVITADHIHKSKPDPEGYLLASKLLNVPANACVVFEDSLQGVIAGKSAGCFVVGLTTTLTEEILSPYADMLVDNLSSVKPEEIITILKER